MSKKEISTRDIIVDKAIELYNAQGIEYVGVRELAKELGMKGGNITYYFPVKDDLVAEIASRLAQTNKSLFSNVENKSMADVLTTYRQIYENQYKYRALMISLPHLLKQNEKFAKSYRRNQSERTESIRSQIDDLIAGGYLKNLTPSEKTVLLSVLTFNNRFWISEAATDGTIHHQHQAIENAMIRLIGILDFVASAKGKKEIAKFLK